jgi:uncharacterized protein
VAADRLILDTSILVAAERGHLDLAAAASDEADAALPAIQILIDAGADPDARFIGRSHQETPLHWAASSGDVEAVDALLDAGANVESPGGVMAGGTPLEDARIFGQWKTAQRLVDVAQPLRWTTKPRSA